MGTINREAIASNPESLGFRWVPFEIGTDAKVGDGAKFDGYRPEFVDLDLVKEHFGADWALSALNSVGPGHAVTNAQRAAVKTGRVRREDKDALFKVACDALAGIRASGTRTVVKYTTAGGTTVTSKTEYLTVSLTEEIETALELGLDAADANKFARVKVTKAYEKIFGEKPNL